MPLRVVNCIVYDRNAKIPKITTITGEYTVTFQTSCIRGWPKAQPNGGYKNYKDRKNYRRYRNKPTKENKDNRQKI